MIQGTDENAMPATQVEAIVRLPFEPFYDQDGITIYNADCRKVLPWLERFDLLLTDPPYGIDAGNMNMGGYASSRLARSDWDKERPARGTIEAGIALCDRSIIWGGNYFELPPTRNVLIWDKTSEIQGRSFAEAELAWCSWDAVVRIYRYAPTQMKKVHKTEKPLGLMKWCIGLAGESVQTVLDPFMGSGTTLLAAKLEGRKAVGIEINRAYCEAAVNRLKQKTLW
jgi:DNA modification methylase